MRPPEPVRSGNFQGQTTVAEKFMRLSGYSCECPRAPLCQAFCEGRHRLPWPACRGHIGCREACVREPIHDRPMEHLRMCEGLSVSKHAQCELLPGLPHLFIPQPLDRVSREEDRSHRLDSEKIQILRMRKNMASYYPGD